MTTPEPRLGLFREGDTVDDERREELQRLRAARLWQFRVMGTHLPRTVQARRFTLHFVGERRDTR